MTIEPLQHGTIFVEDAEILAHRAYPGDQFILRLRAPQCAARACPGSFAHLCCDPMLPMRRPLSIMRASPAASWVEFLYKAVSGGMRLLARRRVGDTLSIMGPIGRAFTLHSDCPRPLLVGGGVGIPPMVFLAEVLHAAKGAWRPLVLLGSELPFPFSARPSKILIPGMPEGVIASMPLLEDWGVPSRLASLQGYPGCYEGYVTELARAWLKTLDGSRCTEVEIFASGPYPMLKAVAALAREYRLPCQISLEEFMACAVGGCAGCTVEVHTPLGPAMKRVCVDGPVFEAAQVFP
jgi:2-polyprenylphenol hydroxylase and related flavodoxin oxidoreductases